MGKRRGDSGVLPSFAWWRRGDREKVTWKRAGWCSARNSKFPPERTGLANTNAIIWHFCLFFLIIFPEKTTQDMHYPPLWLWNGSTCSLPLMALHSAYQRYVPAPFRLLFQQSFPKNNELKKFLNRKLSLLLKKKESIRFSYKNKRRQQRIQTWQRQVEKKCIFLEWNSSFPCDFVI